MRQYHELLERILRHGVERDDRTGTGTLGVFSHTMRFDLTEGFPLVTTRKIFFRGVVEELLWFLRGETNVASLQAAGVRIWDEWATQEQCAKFGRPAGELGPIYGHQWRNFGATRRNIDEYYGPGDRRYTRSAYMPNGFDQIQWVIDEIKKNPSSRRLIVSAWNPVEAVQVTLPPCHTLFQFYVQDGKLSCQLYQRSGDAFLGVPFNVASYALLTHMVAHVTGLAVGELAHTICDAHLYRNHVDHARELLRREPRSLPKITIDPVGRVRSIDDFTFDDVALVGYDPHPAIKADVSV